ncbi:hypothetical protein C8R45DRAFT_1068582, partial [Mycena sanguinolenta]
MSLPAPQPLPFGLREGDIIFLNMNDLPSPERRRVVRPQFTDLNVETPNYMWIIPRRPDSPFLPSRGFDIMVRQEHHDLLVAVLWSLYRQSRVACMKDDFPSHSENVEADMSKPAEDPQDIEPEQLRIPHDLPDVFDATTFPNPFQHIRHGHFYRLGSALIITGLPGIGKTFFLSVIFYLRVAAGFPTAYMQSEKLLLVYDGKRLFLLLTTAMAPLAVPKNAWILVDSDADFLYPPREVVVCGNFILQAASSRPDQIHTAWARKIRGPYQFCLMRPWTLEELFIASSLQTEARSGNDIQAFFNKFGGSARHVYKNSHELSAFERRLDHSVWSWDNKDIHQTIHSFYPVYSHMLIIALPLSDDDRTKFQLTSPTAYLAGKLLRRLNTNVQMARRKLYAINVAGKTPGCKATAKDLLANHHHEFIALGGKWNLRELAKVDEGSSTSETNLWRVTEEDSDWMLEANGRMSVFRKPMSTRLRKRVKTEFTPLVMIDFPSDESTLLMKQRYYRPTETDILMD